MDQARAQIREELATAKCPALLCSFGSDSMLLLYLLREVAPDIPVLWFKVAATNTAFARHTIRELNLVVYSYLPADVYLLAQGDAVVLVQEYSVGADRLPVITDLQHGAACALTAFPARTPQLYLPFDLLFIGYKDTDSHWLKGGSELFNPELTLGRAKVATPIRHMSDDAVRAASLDLGVPQDNTDDQLPLCTRCMTQTSDEVLCPVRGHYIPVEQWEREAALRGFQNRFGLRS